MKFIIKIFINAIALWVASRIVSGFVLTDDLLGIALVALIFGLINTVIKPVVQFFTFPFIIITLGLFTLIINTFLLWLTGEILPSYLTLLNFWSAFWAALIISIISSILNIAVDRKDERLN